MQLQLADVIRPRAINTNIINLPLKRLVKIVLKVTHIIKAILIFFEKV